MAFGITCEIRQANKKPYWRFGVVWSIVPVKAYYTPMRHTQPTQNPNTNNHPFGLWPICYMALAFGLVCVCARALFFFLVSLHGNGISREGTDAGKRAFWWFGFG